MYLTATETPTIPTCPKATEDRSAPHPTTITTAAAAGMQAAFCGTFSAPEAAQTVLPTPHRQVPIPEATAAVAAAVALPAAEAAVRLYASSNGISQYFIAGSRILM